MILLSVYMDHCLRTESNMKRDLFYVGYQSTGEAYRAARLGVVHPDVGPRYALRRALCVRLEP